MSTHFKFSERYAAYFVTFAVVEWVEVFTRNEYRQVVFDSISYCCENKGLMGAGWVLRTNHIHLVISQFWQQDNHPLQLTEAARNSKALEYIHHNPVTSGMVDELPPIHAVALANMP